MLIIDEKIIKIDELAAQLASQFIKLEVVQLFEAKRIAINSDTELQDKIRLLEENHEYINFRPEIKALQKELLMRDDIYQFKIAENDVQASLSDLVKRISTVISTDIPVDEQLPFKKGAHHGRHHSCG